MKKSGDLRLLDGLGVAAQLGGGGTERDWAYPPVYPYGLLLFGFRELQLWPLFLSGFEVPGVAGQEDERAGVVVG